MEIAFFSTKPYDRDYFDRHNERFHFRIHYFETPLNAQTARLVSGVRTVCAFVNDDLSAPVLEVLARRGVELIALRSAGFNHVDLKKAQELDLTVVRVPAYSPYAVAEHAVALILTLNRKTHRAYNRVRDGNFSLDRLVGFDLHGKTVGCVGTGKIGAAFCRIMRGFGCEVLAFDPYPNDALLEAGIEYTELADLLRRSRVVSLHCPLTPETHHLIDAAALQKMTPDATLVNTSRGALIDTAAVIDALSERRLGALALDVYEQEEGLFFEDYSFEILQDEQITRLMTFPNVLITAHQSFFTEEALNEIAETTLENVDRYARGERAMNAVS